MRVLVICSFKERLEGHIAPFVKDQMIAVQSQGVTCECFLVKGSGLFGYLRNYGPLKKKMVSFQPDVIHAHYGLCGLLANMQRKVPVVTTYHGSDINNPKAFRFSKLAIRISAWNIFVSRKTMEIAHAPDNSSLLPCGIDLVDSQLMGKKEARQAVQLDENKRYVLFAGAFDNSVKNAPLAKETLAMLHDEYVELLELKDYSREEVTLLMCAADALLLTSVNEGSPQVIKEAMACGCPIVSVDVGDVKERLQGLDGCFVAQTHESRELAELLRKALLFEGRTDGRRQLQADGLDNRSVAEKLMEIYVALTK